MKLGARVLKTGVAIVFALSLAELLNLPSPVFAGIAAIFAIQPSILSLVFNDFRANSRKLNRRYGCGDL